MRAALGVSECSRDPVKSQMITKPGEGLDQTVHAEGDQGDRSRRDARADGDGELDQVPDVSTPCKESRPAFELFTLRFADPANALDADRHDLSVPPGFV